MVKKKEDKPSRHKKDGKVSKRRLTSFIESNKVAFDDLINNIDSGWTRKNARQTETVKISRF
jgi:hypothetical protein